MKTNTPNLAAHLATLDVTTLIGMCEVAASKYAAACDGMETGETEPEDYVAAHSALIAIKREIDRRNGGAS